MARRELTVVEAAHHFGKSTKTVERWIKDRKLDAWRDSKGRWLIVVDAPDAPSEAKPEVSRDGSSENPSNLPALNAEAFAAQFAERVEGAVRGALGPVEAGLSEHGESIRGLETAMSELVQSMAGVLASVQERERLLSEVDRLRAELARRPRWWKFFRRD